MYSTVIILEGLDGSGKTSVARELANALVLPGRTVLHCREPGSTSLGEELRRLILSTDTLITPLASAMLFMAARAQFLDSIRDAAPSDILILDRFWFSTIAYQAYGQGVSLSAIESMIDALNTEYNFWPDSRLSFYLAVSTPVAQQRMSHRGVSDRFEKAGLEFRQRVEAGYDSLVNEKALTRIDADRPLSVVVQDLLQRILQVISNT